MAKHSEKLRRQKLWWCAENNLRMQQHKDAPVQHVLNKMTDFCSRFSDDMARATDNLQQYLGSDKTHYWENRPQYIEELCAAICLPVEIWNLPDFDQFRDSAKVEYRRLGILNESSSKQYESMYSLLHRFHQLQFEEGSDRISFVLEESKGILDFRRKQRAIESKEIEFFKDDSIRIRFKATKGHYAVLFLIDPVNNCRMVAPTFYQQNTKIDQDLFHIPELSEESLNPPEKQGRYLFYGLSKNSKLSSSLSNSDGVEPLTPLQFEQLLTFCIEAIKEGSLLYRTDFYVSSKIKNNDS